MRTPLCVLLLLALPTVVGAQVTLSLDKSEYVEGDVVEITLHNGSDEPVVLTSAPFYCVVRTDGPYPVCVGLPVIEELPSGESWVAHHDTSALPDPPGEYRIDPVTSLADPVPYTLLATVGDRAPTWSTLKSSFR